MAVLELPARWDGREAALEDVDQLLRRGPTDLAILPELALTGYVSPEGDCDLRRFGEPLDGPTVRAGRELAVAHRVHLVLPLVLADAGAFFNAVVVLRPDGSVAARYAKRHPWFPERWAKPGREKPPCFRVGALSVTVAICFDGHFLPYDAADVLARADLLLFPSAWVDDEDSRLPLLRSIAAGFGIAVANANWAPGAVVLPGQGGSVVLDSAGRVLAEVAPGAARADAVVRPRRQRGKDLPA